MLRPLLFAAAVIALVAPAPAAPVPAADLSGNWLFSTIGPGGESALCILKIETSGGKPAASVVFSPENVETSVADFRANGSLVNVTIKQLRTYKTRDGERKLSSQTAFIGSTGKDPKVILGSTGDSRIRTRAKLTRTEKTTLGNDELLVRTPLPEPMMTIQQMSSKMSAAQSKLLREKDVEKRKELQKEFSAAAREASEKQPALYREVIEKHPESPAVFDAAVNVLRSAARSRLTAEDAGRFVKVVQDQAMPYGPLFAGVTLAPLTETLAAQKGLEAVAVAAIEPVAKTMTDEHPPAIQSLVLSAYQTALAKAGKTAEAKAIGIRVTGLEAKIDAEYLKSMPPFKPTLFAGRKDREANQVVMFELFTGAQCPPCVAADVAFEALEKSYKPTELVLLQYHMHIPGSDPMTNPHTTARWAYYQKLFPYDRSNGTGVGGVPTSIFNGKPATGGGGGMAASENKFRQYCDVINPLLEKTTPVKLSGKATRAGDKLDIAVEVANGENHQLRLLVVEDVVKYAGSNGIRFHHQVVRAMPGGADGVAVKDKDFRHSATVNLAEVRKGLTKYLDDYTAENPNRPFARADRPMDMKTIRVIALIQNDKTGEIAQALQIELEGQAASGE